MSMIFEYWARHPVAWTLLILFVGYQLGRNTELKRRWAERKKYEPRNRG